MIFYGTNGGTATLTVNQLGAEDVVSPSSFRLERETATLTEKAQSIAVGYTATPENGGVSSIIADSWISVDSIDDSSGAIHLSVEENTGATRTGTVSFFHYYSGITATFTVSQEGIEDTIPTINIAPSEIKFNTLRGTQTVEVDANGAAGAIDVATDADWITATPDGTISVAENIATEERTGTVIFYGANGGTATLLVRQAAARRAPAMFYRGLLAVGF